MDGLPRAGKSLTERISGSFKKYNWLGLALALVAAGVCLLFVLPAVLANNPLFTIDYISERPAQVVVYYHGQNVVFLPGSEEYDQLVTACYQALYTETGVYEMGWSGRRFAEARTEGVAVELIYTEPVKLPGRRVTMADPTRLFFPLEVFGFEGEVVFRGRDETYWGLPIRVASLDPVREAVEAIFASSE